MQKGIRCEVATRSRTKPTYPGRLDHVVAGHICRGECLRFAKDFRRTLFGDSP